MATAAPAYKGKVGDRVVIEGYACQGGETQTQKPCQNRKALATAPNRTRYHTRYHGCPPPRPPLHFHAGSVNVMKGRRHSSGMDICICAAKIKSRVGCHVPLVGCRNKALPCGHAARRLAC